MSKVITFANLVNPVGSVSPSLTAAVDAGLTAVRQSAARVRSMPKAERREFLKLASTNWPCISLAEGINPTLRVGKDNPPLLLHGFAADYDNVGKRHTIAELTEIANRCAYPPAAAGMSLSGEGVHAVWLFKEPIPVLGNADYAREVMGVCYKNLRVGNFLQGFDDGFKVPDRLLSIDPENFGWLFDAGEGKVVDEVSTRLWASGITKNFTFEGQPLDLEKVYEQVQKLYPGRWQGAFVVGARGVRFWDSSATDTTAAVVTPSGMVYFSDGGGFKPWSSILGADVSARLTADSIAQSTEAWFYDSAKREYVYYHAPTNSYAPKNRTQLMDRLELQGLSKEADKKAAAAYIEDFRPVAGVVQLANQKRGLITQGGLRYLNTTQTISVTPGEGDCSFIHGLHNAMFGDTQIHYYLAWLRDALQCAHALEPSYGQVCFFAGEVASGKSLVQFRIITPLLGGKWCDPMPFLLGESQFNGEISDSGSWVVSDAEGAKNSSQRASLAQKIKAIAANPCMAIHAKYGQPVTLFLNSRASFSFNKTAECLNIIPRLGSDLLDKINLFSIKQHDYFAGMDRRDIESRITQEIPAFAHWLLRTYQPPKEVLATGRYRVKSYHSPELLCFARASQDSSELLGWVSVMFSQNETLRQESEAKRPVEFSSARWLQILSQTTGHHYSLTPNKLSAHFSHLARQFPEAVSSRLDPATKVYLFKVDYAKLIQDVKPA